MRRQSQLANVPAPSHQPSSLVRGRSHGTRDRSQMGNQAMQRMLRPGLLQPKLTVSQPNDQYEQEADRVAATVMRMPDKSSKTFLTPPNPPNIQRKCADCEQEEEEVQRKASAEDHRTGIEFNHPSGGQPLPASERSFFEPRFGRDFSGVRIHADEQAAQAAHSVRALAYTKGADVVFDEGQYRPGTEGGRRLLAHELAHTIQQRHAAEPIVQRVIGDGHDLTAPRFARNLTLEAVYDNERLLKKGNAGPAVRILQQALLEAGFELPRFGVDGDFGSETEAAVRDFQRASGLTAANIDGIVGPTTMGWLDQRFSAGSTPTGTTPGATTGCPTIKTVNVDLVTLDGSTRNPVQELDRASTIFSQCCVHFNFVSGGSEDATRTQALLGDNILTKTTSCGSPTTEETSLFDGGSADFALSSRVRAFYVDSTLPSVPAYSFPPFCATRAASRLKDMVIVTNRASVRGLAHEFGHLLLNDSVHPNDPLNLMSAPGNPPGEQLTPTDCTTIFANA